MNNSWPNFYKNRVNSYSYDRYFVNQYLPFLRAITSFVIKEQRIIEMGCGIGTVTKMLRNTTLNLGGGFDNDVEMVHLANKNNNSCHRRKSVVFVIDDILGHDTNFSDLYVSHGVLEHFDDDDLKLIIEKYPNGVHYVPLIGWKIPSFGDERLLPLDFWLDMFKPKFYKTFNSDKDLVFST